MRKLKLTTIILLMAAMVYGQGVAINEDGAAPDPSAMLEVTSTEKGILIPRMTQAQRDAILNPANGLMIYQTDATPGFYFYDSSLTPPQWQRFGTDADIFWTSGNGHIHYATGNVGIGTTDPSALLHTHGTSSGGGNVLFTGSFKTTPGDPPAAGAGTRMMWYPDKAAFRAGRVIGGQWDKESIGNYSFATGYGNIAEGISSIAAGSSTKALGNYSVAMGRQSEASGDYSTALGYDTKATGESSFATGYRSNATGFRSTAIGRTIAPSAYETTIGRFNTTYTPESTTDWDINDRLFVIGKGTGNTTRSDAMVILKSGNTGIGTSSPATRLDVNGIITATDGNSGLWNTAYGWGDHATAGYLEDEADPTWGGPADQTGDIGRTGNVGIGTISPSALLHTAGTETGEGNVLFTGVYKSSNPGDPPAEGAGTRMMWYPDKAAFRAGIVEGDQWNKDSIGNYSFATGFNSKALGNNSVSIGRFTKALGHSSIAMGSNATASANSAIAMGAMLNATGDGSVAIGLQTNAVGVSSVAIGALTTASENYSTAMGGGSTASGYGSTAMGIRTTAASAYETVLGRWNTDYTPASTTEWDENDRLFVVGNGTSIDTRSDAMVILKSGNTGIGTSSPTATLHTNGAGAGEGNVLFTGVYKSSDPGAPPAENAGTRMMWYPDKAALRAGIVTSDQWNEANIGNYSVAFGYNTRATNAVSTALGNHTSATGAASTAMGDNSTAMGTSSTAMGNSTVASGSSSTAMGWQTKAQSTASTAMGKWTTASGNNSTAMGFYTTASGSVSTAIGSSITAPSAYETVIGRFNTNYDVQSADLWNINDRLFVVGNGTADETRSDAMVILKSGNTGIGTSTPTTQLHTTGSVRFEGAGTPGEGKILTSDADGNATWQSRSGISPLSCIDIEGNAYPTIVLGNQVWMAENLRVTKYNNGDDILNITDETEWMALTTGAYCWYDNDQTANAKYGALYNWHAVNDTRGLCPEGWRVPSDAEWTAFTNMLGGIFIAGGKLKAVSPLWNDPNIDVTNSTGFSALPGGLRWSNNGSFYDVGSNGIWWSASEYSGNEAWLRSMYSGNGHVSRNAGYKSDGFSVRCLRDN